MRRFASVFVVLLAALSAFTLPAAAAPATGWHRKTPPLATRWTNQVGQEYRTANAW